MRRTLAAVQFRPRKGDWEASVERLAALVLRAREEAGEGHLLVVCPEMALTGYLFRDDAAAGAVAEPAQGRTYARCAALCAEAGCYLVIGYPEAAAGVLYNAALVIGPSGALLANYRKRLLYECDETWACPGDLPYPVLDTPLGRLTVGICMDLNDDRFVHFLHQHRTPVHEAGAQPGDQPGAKIVAFCTNWIHQGMDIRPYWRMRLAGAPWYFVAADTYGHEDDGWHTTRYLGRSAILSPSGRTLAIGPEEGDAVLLAQVPPCPSQQKPRK